ncbi:hypothetical protein [Burkholderia thailandensis]|uniref:hypothetical protein n=1 Tax=Burkholderia thailandensis TaxID=57975 RepID=UPI00298F9DA2|nr:hypothetical protein [Burkholderia thailandensis]
MKSMARLQDFCKKSSNPLRRAPSCAANAAYDEGGARRDAFFHSERRRRGKIARASLEMAAGGHIFGRGGQHARRPPGPAFERRLSGV